MGKVYGYCRTALADKEEITKRIDLIKRYCEDNGLKLEKCFYDDGVSGFDTGEDFKQLMRELENGDTVILRDSSQLSRRHTRLIMLIKQFNNMGVKVMYIEGDEVDTSTISQWINERIIRQQRQIKR